MSERGDKDDMDLGALIDGELEPERRAELEARIKADPMLSARLAALREDKQMLRRIFEPVAQRPIPQAWLATAYGTRPKTTWRMVGSIAAVLLIGVIGTLTYVQLRPPVGVEIVQEALDARSASVRPQQVITVAEGDEVSRFDPALRAAVGWNIQVPDMRKAGYRLTAIRVFSHGAAELDYRDGKNRLFTLYVRRSDGTPRFDQFERDGLRVCVWQDDVLSMVMAGDMSTAAMQRLASLAYTGLTF